MRQWMTGFVLFVGAVVVLSAMAGCDCCGARKPAPEAPIVQVPPREPAPMAPVPPPPPAPTPLEIPAPPPPPTPIVTHEAPKTPDPVTTEVPQEVAKAIEDLGTRYPGLFTFDRQRGMFRFNSDITFDSGSSVVKPQARAALTKLAEILSGDQAKDRQLSIVGYTDSDRVRKASTIAYLRNLGKAANNQGLSEARAESVQAILASGGVAQSRMSTRGLGAANPVAANTSAAGKAQNRRVEIYLTPMSR